MYGIRLGANIVTTRFRSSSDNAVDIDSANFGEWRVHSIGMHRHSAERLVTAEVVGTGSDGTEPSLLLSVQRHGLYSDDKKVLKRYLFNCGEGTQRLAGENGIKLNSLDAMYFTRFDVKSVSGVPGVIFSLDRVAQRR
ncbi:hypothetical protein PInf_012199 [Phytophthora infestans]|nr:hypothetical protein PInf_012199 [Phytophthora infestans]